MFDIGISELIVVAVVALLVFGPKRLPELARALGKGILELRKAAEGIRAQVREESESLKGSEHRHDTERGEERTVLASEDYSSINVSPHREEEKDKADAPEATEVPVQKATDTGKEDAVDGR